MLIVAQNFLNQLPNMKVVLDGHHSMNHYLMHLKQKQIIYLVTLEQNIIAKIVAHITDIYLMMVLILLAKDTVTTEYAYYLYLKNKLHFSDDYIILC